MHVAPGLAYRGNPGRGTNAGLQEPRLARRLEVRGGEGKFEGEGGFSDPLHPLQGRLAAHSARDSSFKHSWARRALQTRILSTSAEAEASEAQKNALGTSRVKCYLGPRALANGSAFRVLYLHIGAWPMGLPERTYRETHGRPVQVRLGGLTHPRAQSSARSNCRAKQL